MIEALIRLIHEYQSKVQEAVELFERYKRLQRPRYPLDWTFSGISRSGYLDSQCQISYFLHGYGCCVNWSSSRVDWDFGEEGQIDGFDVWRLHDFVEGGTQNFPEFQDEGVLQAVFEDAKSQGLFYQTSHRLYYLICFPQPQRSRKIQNSDDLQHSRQKIEVVAPVLVPRSDESVRTST
jgi:hypothetical protein